MNVYQVENLTKVNVSRYVEGDVFMTKSQVGILHNGKIEKFLKQTDVVRIVRNEMKKVKTDDQ